MPKLRNSPVWKFGETSSHICPWLAMQPRKYKIDTQLNVITNMESHIIKGLMLHFSHLVKYGKKCHQEFRSHFHMNLLKSKKKKNRSVSRAQSASAKYLRCVQSSTKNSKTNTDLKDSPSYLIPNICSESSQIFKMEWFAKIVKNYNHFSKALYVRSLTEFWIRPSLNKHSLTCSVTLRYVWEIQKHAYYRKFRQIQAYLYPIQAYLAILWHI